MSERGEEYYQKEDDLDIIRAAFTEIFGEGVDPVYPVSVAPTPDESPDAAVVTGATDSGRHVQQKSESTYRVHSVRPGTAMKGVAYSALSNPADRED